MPPCRQYTIQQIMGKQQNHEIVSVGVRNVPAGRYWYPQDRSLSSSARHRHVDR